MVKIFQRCMTYHFFCVRCCGIRCANVFDPPSVAKGELIRESLELEVEVSEALVIDDDAKYFDLIDDDEVLRFAGDGLPER